MLNMKRKKVKLQKQEVVSKLSIDILIVSAMRFFMPCKMFPAKPKVGFELKPLSLLHVGNK